MEIICAEKPEFWIEQWRLLNKSATAFKGYGKAGTWNAMALNYGNYHERDEKEKRISEIVEHLQTKGVRFDDCRILDIGCGPGMYASAFAKRGAQVVCIDIAEKMIERLKKEMPQEVRKRITSIVTDWQDFDLSENGFTYAFDLVFANMTPAISGPDAFLKIMKASRKWCWFQGWAGKRDNPLLERIHKAVLNVEASPFQGNFLYAFNLAYTSGFSPDCSFRSIEWTKRKSLEDSVEYYTTFFSSRYDIQSNLLRAKVTSILSEQERNGYIENTAKGCIGRMLWNINENQEAKHD